MELKVIAYARNGFSQKFGIPRQSRKDSCLETCIVFAPTYRVREALRGIEDYTHLWLLWGFHEAIRQKGEEEKPKKKRAPRKKKEEEAVVSQDETQEAGMAANKN